MIKKTIANCTPVEFMEQGYKVAKKAGELFGKSKVLELRGRQPDYKGDESEDERKELANAQAKRNIVAMLERLMCEYPDDTCELLGLMAFIPKEELSKHTGLELMGVGISVLMNKEVLDFLSLLGR